MFETAQKYSEITYYSKRDLERELDHYLVEPLWHEITQYRNFFKYDFPIHNRNTFLIRSPYVNDCIARTHEMMQAYTLAYYDAPLTELDCFWLHDSEIPFYQSFVSQLQHRKYYDHRVMLTRLMEQMQLTKQFAKPFIDFMMCEENVLLKLFLCSSEGDKRTAFLFFYPLLRQHGMLSVANGIRSEDLVEISIKKDADLDVTGRFLSFLEHIRLKLSSEMVLLKTVDKTNVCEMQTQELIEQYPMLHKEQILFYVSHRALHHYYTLQDYMNQHQCCYETARYSMEKLVEMKWYQKQKMGKKFVYFIL